MATAADAKRIERRLKKELRDFEALKEYFRETNHETITFQGFLTRREELERIKESLDELYDQIVDAYVAHHAATNNIDESVVNVEDVLQLVEIDASMATFKKNYLELC